MKPKIIDYIETVQEDEDRVIDSILNENYQELVEKDWDELISEFITKTKNLELESKIEIAVLAGMILYRLYLENNGGDF